MPIGPDQSGNLEKSPSDVLNCPECGWKVPAESAQCQECGHWILNEDRPHVVWSPPRGPGVKMVAVAILVMIGIMFAVALVNALF